MRERITIYQKPTCSKCRESIKILKEKGVPFDSIDHILESPTTSELASLVKKLGLRPRELFRTKEPLYRELNLAERELSDADLLRILSENPELLERPIVVRGKKAVIARPAEKLYELFE